MISSPGAIGGGAWDPRRVPSRRLEIHLVAANPQQTEPLTKSTASATFDGHDHPGAGRRGEAHARGEAGQEEGSLRIVAILVGCVVLKCSVAQMADPRPQHGGRPTTTAPTVVGCTSRSVRPRVPGQVTKVFVDDNYRVKQGDLIVQLDKEPYQIQVDLKEAAFETAQANVLVAQDQVRGIVAQARGYRYRLAHAIEDVNSQLALLKAKVDQLAVEKANLVLAEQDFARSQSLVVKGAVSQQVFDQDKAKLDVAKNRVTAAQQDIQQVRAGLGLPIDFENPLKYPPDLDQNFSTVRQAPGRICWAASRRWASIPLRTR